MLVMLILDNTINQNIVHMTKNPFSPSSTHSSLEQLWDTGNTKRFVKQQQPKGDINVVYGCDSSASGIYCLH